MIVRRCTVNVRFQHFWMKTVEDVNLDQHCIKCLIGDRDYRFSANCQSYENVELPDKVHYLCGVVFPLDWVRNFHLAFRPCKGKVLTEEQNGVWIQIEDAEKLPISPEFIDRANPHCGEPLYATCRNWQFAHWFRHNVLNASGSEPDKQKDNSSAE